MPRVKKIIPSTISVTEAAIKLRLDYPEKQWQRRFFELDDLDGSLKDRDAKSKGRILKSKDEVLPGIDRALGTLRNSNIKILKKCNKYDIVTK